MVEPLIRMLVRFGLRKAFEPEIPEARIADAPPDPLRWVRRGILLGVLVFGWVFIAWQNKFHITAPVVFVCLGYLAVVATVFNLWRTGASAVSPEYEGEAAWAKPEGARVELEKEKRTLLKAIKEAEFDHQMGKLSKRDADDLIRTYRARAIEVIKELDRLEAGQAESVRERIAREVKARIELGEKKPSGKKGKQAKPESESKQEAKAEAKISAKSDAKPDAKPDAKAAAKIDATAEAKSDAEEPVAATKPSETAEPTSEPATKEVSP